MTIEGGLAAILPQDLCWHFAAAHPRHEGSVQKGVGLEDGVQLLPLSIRQEDLQSILQESLPKTVIAYLAEGSEASNESVAHYASLVHVLLDRVSKEASLELVVPMTFVRSDVSASCRSRLLEMGSVMDLVDGGEYWLISWVGSGIEVYDKQTQVLRVPPPDVWPEFREELRSWLPIWRWADMTYLPISKPWTWENIEPNVPGMILKLLEERNNFETGTPLMTVAYNHIGIIEIGLRYLVQLRIGDDSQELLRLLPPSSARNVRERLEREGRGAAVHYMDLIHYKKLITRAWNDFQSIFDPTSQLGRAEALPNLDLVNKIRNRTMHPTRMTGQRLTEEDVSALSLTVEAILAAIRRAEAIQQLG